MRKILVSARGLFEYFSPMEVMVIEEAVRKNSAILFGQIKPILKFKLIQ